MKELFKILEHPADLGIEAYGNSMEDVFKNSAKGLIFIIAGNSKIDNNLTKKITISAMDRENMFVRWLNEILFLYDSEKFLMSDVEFKNISDTSLCANVAGEKYNKIKHQLKLDVKAVTYHNLIIEKERDIWKSRVYLDV